MTFGGFLWGAFLFLLAFAPMGWGAWRLRARILPDWDRAHARLAEIVLVLVGAIGTSQVLGAVGLFRRLPLVAACLTTGVVVAVFAGPAPRPRLAEGPSRSRSTLGLAWLALAVGISVLAIGSWVIAAVAAWGQGITEYDSLWYQLPHAARFVQEGWLTRIHLTSPFEPDAFHPANGEVVQAMGMLLFGRDILSPFINLAWAGGTFLAAWCVGASRNRGPLALLLAAPILAAPAFALKEGGSAKIDIAATFFVISAVALLLQERSRPAMVLAAIAAGMAVGTKLTVAIPIAALSLGVFVTMFRTRRWLWFSDWVLPLVLASAYWFIRNFIRTGNPVPIMGIDIGPVSLPRVPLGHIDRIGYSVASYAFEIEFWRDWFGPTLAAFFGKAWILTVALVGLGIASAILRGSTAVVRMLGVVASAAVVGYLITPTTAMGVRGTPLFLGENVRYVVPGALLGVLLIAVVVVPANRWVEGIIVLLAVGAFVGGLIVDLSPWRTPWWSRGVVVTVVAATAAFCVLLAYRIESLKLVAALCALIAVCSLVGGFYAADRYLKEGRLTQPLAQWADGVHDARIALAGDRRQYHLYDSELSNHVQYVGARGPHEAFGPASSCTAWRAALRRGRFEFVVLSVGRFDYEPTVNVAKKELPWTMSDPAASRVLQLSDVFIFAFDPAVPDPGCKRTTSDEPIRARNAHRSRRSSVSL